MNKQKGNKPKLRYQQRVKTHAARFPHAQAVVQFAPSRESTTPFCAYFGPNGEICSCTDGLILVKTLPSIPRYQFMACPSHYAIVYQQIATFLKNLAQT